MVLPLLFQFSQHSAVCLIIIGTRGYALFERADRGKIAVFAGFVMVLSLYRVLADLTVLQGVAHIRHQRFDLALKQPQLF